MDENKGQPGKVSTCFEGSSCAEIMQKVMGEAGVGSLCEEMMRSLMNRRGEGQSEPQAAKKEEGHGKEE